MRIKFYKGKWNYINAETVSRQTNIYPPEDIITKYYSLLKTGWMSIFDGYVNDGASFICIDTDTVRPGAMWHDAGYEILRSGKLPDSTGKWRERFDDLLKEICLEDGMCRPRAWWIHRVVRRGAGPAAHPRRRRKLRTAGKPTAKQLKENEGGK